MKKLIVLSGAVGRSFFLNELKYFEKYYDSVTIIDFNADIEKGKMIEEKYGYKYLTCCLNYFRRICSIKFFKWLLQDYVREEINRNVTFSVVGVKKFCYIIFYGLYAIQSKEMIDKEIKEWDGDVDLYAYWLSRPAFSIAQYNKQRNGKIKHIFSRAHGYDLYKERNSMGYLPFRRYVDNNLDKIYFISEHGERYYASQVSENTEFSAERGISRLGIKETKYRKQYRHKEEIVIVSCSSIISVKRLDLIACVIARLNDSHNIKWFHFGDGDLKESILNICEKQMFNENYHFMGNVDNALLLQKYQEIDADFFINLSDSEGIPVSVMEAMSFGIPVIARNVGGMGEIVDSQNGLLLHTDNVDNIVAAINELFVQIAEDEKVYKDMCKAAYSVWQENYNAEINYSDFFKDIQWEERDDK